jgi:capsular exopolysaccharide synthesis family protein
VSIQNFVKLLRRRWLLVCSTIAIAVLAAVAINLLTTPKYEASTRLFVSAASGGSVDDMYTGTLFSQERVKSYTQLIMGATLAQRTIDKLHLNMTAEELQHNVKAAAKIDTVLIDVAVTDPSPAQASTIANTLSDEFVSMVRELETPADGTKPDARVVVEQRATLPRSPVAPASTRNIAIGILGGLMAGIALAVLRDLFDNTVNDGSTIEEITGVGLVGSIPVDKERRKEPAISFDGDRSAIAEAFRRVRTNLQFLAVDNPPRVIVVTSSVANEGKSTTAVNIALALAEADHSVVLIDGDLRRPRLDSYLQLIGSVGFSTVLAGKASVSEVLQKARYPGLSVLTSGTLPPNPSELLGSLAAKKVIDELRGQFDYVVVDSSPLLAVTDAAILSANADGVLILTRYRKTKREELAHAVENLEKVDATLLGAILTMTPARGNTSYTYQYYGDDNPTPSSPWSKAVPRRGSLRGRRRG